MAPIRARDRKKAQNKVKPPQLRRGTIPPPPNFPNKMPLADASITSGTPSETSRMTSARPLSSLERLPTELIQIIFFECLNISLPQASYILGSSLSSFFVKSQLFFLAFSSDGAFKLRHREELLRLFPSKQGIAQLQTSILQLKWMTMGFLNQCLLVYLERELLSRCIASQSERVHGIPTQLQFFKYAPDVNEGECHGEYYQRPLQWFFGTADFFISIRLPYGRVILRCSGSSKERRGLKGRPLYCIDNCRIPCKLLHGPWTDEKCQFLDTLLRNGATIDWIHNTSGDVAELGFQDALEEHNVRAVEILTRKYTQSTQKRSGDALKYKFFGSGLGFRPNRQHLRLAVIKYNCQIEILKIIMREGRNMVLHYLDPADRPLFVWAQQRSNEGDLRGDWILEHFRYGNK